MINFGGFFTGKPKTIGKDLTSGEKKELEVGKGLLKYIKNPSKDECVLAVGANGLALEFVPKDFVDLELCLLAVNSNGLALRLVPDKLRTKEVCEAALKDNPSAEVYAPIHTPKGLKHRFYKNFWYLPRSYDYFLGLVKENGLMLSQVPQRLLTDEVCWEAIKSRGRALRWLPERYRTKEEYQRRAIDQDPSTLTLIPQEDRYKFYGIIVNQQKFKGGNNQPLKGFRNRMSKTIRLIPESYWTSGMSIEFWLEGLGPEVNPEITYDFTTEEKRQEAVSRDVWALVVLCNLFSDNSVEITEAVYLAAFDNYPYALELIPEENRTEAIYIKSVEKDAKNLTLIPGANCTEAVYLTALKLCI